MLVGILADSHDNLPLIQKALDAFNQRGVSAILHAGDIVAPFAAGLLTNSGVPVVAVYGNNDGERKGLRKACESICEPPHRFEMAGRTIVLAHNAQRLAPQDVAGADVVVHGHTHGPVFEPGPPLIVNPGESGGWVSGRCTCAVVDLRDLTGGIVELGTQETVKI